MGVAPSVRTFSYEKRSTELIGPAVDNNLNVCMQDDFMSPSVNSQNDEFTSISNNDIFRGKAN